MDPSKLLTGLNLLDPHLSVALRDFSSSPLTSESSGYFARFTTLLCDMFVVYMPTLLYLMIALKVWR